MGDLGFNEIIVIVIFAIILYGKDLPQAARKLSGLYGKFRRQLADIKDELQRQIPPEDLKLPVSANDFNAGDPPPTPTGLTAAAEHQEVTLNWTAADDTNYYAIKRAAGPEETPLEIATSIYGTSYTDYGLTEGVTYRYVILAVNNFGQSPQSDEVSVTVGTPSAAPAPAGGNGSASPDSGSAPPDKSASADSAAKSAEAGVPPATPPGTNGGATEAAPTPETPGAA